MDVIQQYFQVLATAVQVQFMSEDKEQTILILEKTLYGYYHPNRCCSGRRGRM